MLRATGGIITRELRRLHPAFRAIRDLEDRAGMRDGSLRREPDFDPDANPFADEWISTSDAAARKGVTLGGLLGAVRRGDVIARPRQPGGTWREVSLASLEHWQPDTARQAARRREPAGRP